MIHSAISDLRWFYQHSESALGVRSSFGALVDMAMSGLSSSGRNTAEDKAAAVCDRGGEERNVERHRRVRRCLADLSVEHQRVLWAACGPHDWTKLADLEHGRGTGQRLMRAMGDLVGVALLTPTLLTPTLRGIVVSAVPTYVGDRLVEWVVKSDARLDAVRSEARSMLKDALAAYGGEAPKSGTRRSVRRIGIEPIEPSDWV